MPRFPFVPGGGGGGGGAELFIADIGLVIIIFILVHSQHSLLCGFLFRDLRFLYLYWLYYFHVDYVNFQSQAHLSLIYFLDLNLILFA